MDESTGHKQRTEGKIYTRNIQCTVAVTMPLSKDWNALDCDLKNSDTIYLTPYSSSDVNFLDLF